MKIEYTILPMKLDQAGLISSKIKSLLMNKGINKMIIRRVAIAVFEAEINVVIHSRGGKCIINYDNDLLYIHFEDKGPGIQNIEEAMVDGYTTASDIARQHGFGAGRGLLNIKNSSDYFNIMSSNKGTIVDIKFDLKV